MEIFTLENLKKVQFILITKVQFAVYLFINHLIDCSCSQDVYMHEIVKENVSRRKIDESESSSPNTKISIRLVMKRPQL